MLRILVAVSTAILSIQAAAEMTPAETKVLWERLKSAQSERVLTEYLTPEITEVIEWYTQQSPEVLNDVRFRTEATPAAFALGMVAGAAAASAELAFEAIGGKTAYPQIATETSYDLLPAFERPHQLTPAAAAAAAGGIGGVVGHKLVEYVAKTLDGKFDRQSPVVNDRDFDLR